MVSASVGATRPQAGRSRNLTGEKTSSQAPVGHGTAKKPAAKRPTVQSLAASELALQEPTVVVPRMPRVVRALPGRLRVHLLAWSGQRRTQIESRIRQAPGVRSVQASPVTSNVLVCFDPAVIPQQTILDMLQAAQNEALQTASSAALEPEDEVDRPPVLVEQRGVRGRARIAVRGLDRHPMLAQRVVERLERRGGVRAAANALTGRVLVEFNEHEIELEDLICDIVDLELPALPGEDRPAHPLDSEPLIQSATRTAGAAIGLGLLATRQLAGIQVPLVSGGGPVYTSAAIGVLQGFPATRNTLRGLFGKDIADLILSVPDIISLALSGNPWGLAVAGSGALRLLTEVLARRAAWHRYEEKLDTAAHSYAGTLVRIEPGERIPRAGRVVEGTGAAIGHDGLPVPLVPGSKIGAGARCTAGPLVLELAGRPFIPASRPAPPTATLYDHYTRYLGPISLVYTALTALLTRSPARILESLLLVNPRTALIGTDFANTSASARVLRAGVIVVGTRPERLMRLPNVLLLDGPRLLADGLEVCSVLLLNETSDNGTGHDGMGDNEAGDAAELLSLAAGIAAAAGSPWGHAFPPAGRVEATEGSFDGHVATALVEGVRYTLGANPDTVSSNPQAYQAYADQAFPEHPQIAEMLQRHQGDCILTLNDERAAQPVALFILRPRLATQVAALVRVCHQAGVEIVLVGREESRTAQAVAHRAKVSLQCTHDPVTTIQARQAQGATVAFVSDHAHAGAAFAACDLAIGVSSGRSGRFPARVDLLAPDLEAIAAIIETGARRKAAVRDAVALSMVSNVGGVAWGLRGGPGVRRASYLMYLTSLTAMAVGWLRLRGGERSPSAVARLADPRPERWGRQTTDEVLQTLGSDATGLTSTQAALRQRTAPAPSRRNELVTAALDQIRSPLTGVLLAAGGISLVMGKTVEVVLLGVTIVANTIVGAWQEYQAGRATEALRQLGPATARVLRDGTLVTLPAGEVVPGDILALAAGDHVAADARVLTAHALEVDEAALTGESLPVAKIPWGGTPASHIVLEGSGVTVGTGRAVVVATGQQTRMGATAAALALDDIAQSPLGRRLNQLLMQALPLAAAGGLIVMASGLLRGWSLLSQLTVGTTIAIAAVPEGLPLLVGVAEAAVARRLAGRQALVHRLSAVEALGRVDVACTDKTGTLTEGRLVLSLVADFEIEAPSSATLTADLRHLLLTAALASPHSEAPDVAAHPTDMAVIRGAQGAGLDEAMRATREAESPFDPVRSFHATVAQDRLCLKGASEVLIARCTHFRARTGRRALTEAKRQQWLARAKELAERGLRVLMVAEGADGTTLHDPQGLVALGFVGISDPLRADVPAVVRRCREAGVRVIMITGDHPATARAIACEAGILDRDSHTHEAILTGGELAQLQNGDLDARLRQVAVIARATPLDKLRIVEGLQRLGHTVAMTGDGVNDAPALRLADVGVAMGRHGTEVARQAADVVLADDDFSTLVEAFVEGRSFWRNIRRSLGLLLGGNLGELGLQVGASVLGLAPPLLTTQILAVNLVTDILPAVAVALQQPEQRELSSLAREQASALDSRLRSGILSRGAATTVPALLAYLIAGRTSGMVEASSVAFISVVTTQLAQTLDSGWTEGGLTPPVLGAVAGSLGMLGLALLVNPIPNFLSLVLPSPANWLLIGVGTLMAVIMGRLALPSTAPNFRMPALTMPTLPRPALAVERSPLAAARSSLALPLRVARGAALQLAGVLG